MLIGRNWEDEDIEADMEFLQETLNNSLQDLRCSVLLLRLSVLISLVNVFVVHLMNMWLKCDRVDWSGHLPTNQTNFGYLQLQVIVLSLRLYRSNDCLFEA